MATQSKIEWTDTTWNPVRGCTKISPGCKFCYAEAIAERFRGTPGHPFENGFDLQLVPERLTDPFKWVKSRRVFVNSMSDLFHEGVPDDFIFKVVSVMADADWHTYQVLTKRPERMQHLLHTDLRFAAKLPHIWWGVSVEDRLYGKPRIETLQETVCENRFLSIEPLLEWLKRINLDCIGWVIVGGESGPHARPMDEQWVLSIKDHCEYYKVPFFFKQWGGPNKKETGRELQGRTYDETPKFQHSTAPDHKTRAKLMEMYQ